MKRCTAVMSGKHQWEERHKVLNEGYTEVKGRLNVVYHPMTFSDDVEIFCSKCGVIDDRKNK